MDIVVFYNILNYGRATGSNGVVAFATINSFITIMCNMKTSHCTPASFVLLVIHLGAELPSQLLFLKATVAFMGSTDRLS